MTNSVVTTIGKICTRFSSGKGISAAEIFSEGKFPVYGGNGLRGYTNSFNFDGECAIIGRQGAYCGNVRYFKGKAWMTEHAIIACARKEHNTGFLAYKLSLMNLYQYQGQSAQPGLSAKTLSELVIELPDLEVQNRVFRLLKSIDDKVMLNSSIITELESLAKTIYNFWFLQFEFPNEAGNPYKSSGGEMFWTEELKSEIPVGWKVVKLGDILFENKKSKVQVGEAKLSPGKIPFFTSGNKIFGFSEHFVEGVNMFLNTGGNADVKLYVGQAAYSTDTWCINFGNHTFFIYLYLLSIKQILNDSFFTGSGLKHLQKNQLKDHLVLYPSKEIIEQFNELASPLFRNISLNYIENQELESLRNYLLPLLINRQATF